MKMPTGPRVRHQCRPVMQFPHAHDIELRMIRRYGTLLVHCNHGKIIHRDFFLIDHSLDTSSGPAVGIYFAETG